MMNKLEKKQFRFHFRSGYILKIRLPTKITIYQLNKLIQSFSFLHLNQGQRKSSTKAQSSFLTVLNNNLVLDFILSSHETSSGTFQHIQNQDYQIVYPDLIESNEKPLNFYQLLENFKKNIGFCVRHKENGQLYSIFSFQKHQCTYKELENIFYIREFLINQNKDHSNDTVALFQAFQTENYLHLVVDFVPTSLNEMNIFDEQIYCTIISRVAKILHQMEKNHLDIENIGCQDLGLINNRLVLRNINLIKKKMDKIKKYHKKLAQIAQNLLLNLKKQKKICQLAENLLKKINSNLHEYIDYLTFLFHHSSNQPLSNQEFMKSFSHLFKKGEKKQNDSEQKHIFTEELMSQPVSSYFKYKKDAQKECLEKTILKGEKQRKHRRNSTKNSPRVSYFL